METYKHLSNYLKRRLNKARFILNLYFRNLNLADKIRVTFWTLAITALAWTTVYQEATKFNKRVVYIEISHAAVVKIPEEKVAVSEVTKPSQESIEESSKVKSQESSLGEAGIEKLIRQYFPEEPETALAIFKVESGLNPETPSGTDIMKDGRPFSFGLAQANLTYSVLGGIKCYEAFNGRNYNASVINEELYQKCIKLANDPIVSLKFARELYNSRGFSPWGAYTNKSYLSRL